MDFAGEDVFRIAVQRLVKSGGCSRFNENETTTQARSEAAVNRSQPSRALVFGVLTATIPTFLLVQAVTFLCFVPLILGSFSILLGLSALRKDSQLRPYVGWISFVISVVAVAVPFGVLSYHNRSGYPVVLVIPDGYRGPVKLIIDRHEGVDVPQK